MTNITKDIFLNSIDCLRRAWLMMREKEEGTVSELSAAERMRMEDGREIGSRARTLYPEGKLIEEKSLKSAIKATGASISNDSLMALFEAAFLHDNLTARADIIVRESSHWHLIEVKSGKEATNEYIADIAYTMTVLRMAGLPITRASLMCVSGDYRLGMTDEALFSYFDVTVKAAEISDSFAGKCPDICRTLASPSPPAPVWKPACKGCTYFENCTGSGIANPIFDLPRITAKTIERLVSQGIHAIEDISASFALSANQLIV
ncbi:MAG TPA: Dna2/Cas4 domain-containing protein, partial [Candidatus Wallbacteria bacterium]|nr:Dna2/Cas4 domain-containing protein [Candidatus Wallbacteria bacterium]